MNRALLSLASIVPLFAGSTACAPRGPRGVDPMLSVNTLVAAPADYAAARIGSAAYPIPPWARHLRGVRIVLDPGHGGDSQQRGFKRGPSGVREAEMNLRVAQYLRDALLRGGAEVRLTREADFDLTHAARAAVANAWPADFFISLHHNAIENKPTANYSSVWYHGGVDTSPSSLDLARYLCDGIETALALPQVTDVPLKSDQLMYADGFAVLRHATVTAALVESSFYTNPDEEQRLRRPEYNLREAYGLFLAIARYAQAGLPRATLVSPADATLAPGHGRRLVFMLDDGLRSRKSWGFERQMILSDSIVTRVAGRAVVHTFTNSDYRLEVAVPDDLRPGSYPVEVQFQNLYKNSVLNPRHVLTLTAGGALP